MLKVMYLKRFNKIPPKTHNLVYLVEGIDLDLDATTRKFIENLNRVSIPTRYPQFLSRLLKDYHSAKTKTIFKQTKEVLQCLKKELKLF